MGNEELGTETYNCEIIHLLNSGFHAKTHKKVMESTPLLRIILVDM